MKRERAVELVEVLLGNLEVGFTEWPLTLVREVYVFGSFARGALQPHDVDILIEMERRGDDRWASHFVQSMSYGRNPYSIVRRALVGNRRGCQIICESEGQAITEKILLWKRGDSVDTALVRLHGIPEDPAAGRALRDAMIPEFEGLDSYLPLYNREDILAAVDSGALRIERLSLPDVTSDDPDVQEWIEDRWARTSPLYRAAHAVVAHWESRGIDPGRAHLHGKDVRDGVTPFYGGFSLRYLRSMPWCLTEHGGVEWIEVVHPTRKQPLECLKFLPGNQKLLEELRW